MGVWQCKRYFTQINTSHPPLHSHTASPISPLPSNKVSYSFISYLLFCSALLCSSLLCPPHQPFIHITSRRVSIFHPLPTYSPPQQFPFPFPTLNALLYSPWPTDRLTWMQQGKKKPPLNNLSKPPFARPDRTGTHTHTHTQRDRERDIEQERIKEKK